MTHQMQTIDIHYAIRHLFKLLNTVINNQEFILEDEGKPVAYLIPFKADEIIRRLGAMRG